MKDVKKKRVDAKKNKAKIVKKVIKDPLATQREIAKDAGIGKTTVQEHLKELNTTKDDRIIWICEQDIDIVKEANEVRARYIKQIANKEEDLKPSEISEVDKISNTSQKRYSIFMWDRTDKLWGEKIININDLYDNKE